MYLRTYGGGNDTSKAKYWCLLKQHTNMQRKPIANKYRKGTMKSTLYSTYILFTESVSAYTVIHKYTSSTGSERESEIALQIIRRLHIIIRHIHNPLMYDDIYMSHTHIFSEVQSDRVSLRHCISVH
jgi:hypothetical protein